MPALEKICIIVTEAKIGKLKLFKNKLDEVQRRQAYYASYFKYFRIIYAKLNEMSRVERPR